MDSVPTVIDLEAEDLPPAAPPAAAINSAGLTPTPPTAPKPSPTAGAPAAPTTPPTASDDIHSFAPVPPAGALSNPAPRAAAALVPTTATTTGTEGEDGDREQEELQLVEAAPGDESVRPPVVVHAAPQEPSPARLSDWAAEPAGEEVVTL